MLRKRDVTDGVVVKAVYPNQGIVLGSEGEKIFVKGVLPGQKVRVRITKKRETHLTGRLMEVISRSPDETERSECSAFPECGGCLAQYLPYEKQLAWKERQMLDLFEPALALQREEAVYDGIMPSPKPFGYRNKVEFSFGNDRIGGPLHLGFHRRGTTYDILMGDTCTIVDRDVRTVVRNVWEYCVRNDLPMYQKSKNSGFLRHLLVRRSEKTGELLVCLVTTSETEHDFRALAQELLALPSGDGTIPYAGILHGINDLPADTVQYQSAEILYGQDFLVDELLGLSFKISVFSFFQTNTKGAEVLYDVVRRYLRTFTEGMGRKPVLYDLYSGTGTIAQIVSPEAAHVYGVEIVEEAVHAARENAALNGIGNCTFLCGDVLKMLDEIAEKPDYIILDPPREGISPKALQKIMRYGVPRMIYISCKATSFIRDMALLRREGWQIERYTFCDLFPQTPHCETVCLLTRKETSEAAHTERGVS